MRGSVRGAGGSASRMPRRTPQMALLHPDLRPGPCLRLTVTDTGTGMTPEVMERAFDPFFTTKKPGEGSGMGLAMAHGIVKDHGGAITVYSEVGKGSTFNVFFPQVEAEGLPSAAASAPLATGSEHILLVDDERAQVESIRNMLRRLGYKVVGKTDSQKALDLFLKDPRAFDLVITDQTMPHLTGAELADRILHVRPDIPVILCTGFSEMMDHQRGPDDGHLPVLDEALFASGDERHHPPGPGEKMIVRTIPCYFSCPASCE